MRGPYSKSTIGGILLLLLISSPGWAQSNPPSSIELIVRPTPETGLALQQKLASNDLRKEGADSLFEGVQSVSPIVPETPRREKMNGEDGPPRAFTLRVQDSTSFQHLRRRWNRHPDVRYAHPNYEFQVHSDTSPAGPLGSNNELADSLDHLEVVEALDAWGVTTGRDDVEIGVVDTGFYLEHPDLAPEFWINDAEDVNNSGRFDEGDLNGVDDDGNGFVDDVIGYDFVDRVGPVQEGEYEERDPDPSADPDGSGSGHGTSVAGVAAATPGNREAGIAGVAPDVRLVALRAFGGDGVGQSDDIAAAIVYGAMMEVDVLNLSFGRNRSTPVIKDAIQYAEDQGTVVVASAGNELTDESHYPSDYPTVLSVVWLAEDGEGVPQFNRSQFGIGVDIGAPGSNVYSADFPAEQVRNGGEPGREDLYRTISGSSFSAPQVAGAAALLRSADSTLSPASIRSILTGAAEDIEGENWDITTGAGLLDVSNSLARAYPARTEIVSPDHDQGISTGEPVPIVGTALDPSFAHYSVFVAEGTRDINDRENPWREISPSHSRQVLRDTLTTWDVPDREGAYTLRLVTTLRDGRTIEDRRRIFIDRSPPAMEVEFLGSGRVQGDNGVIGDVETDDLARVRMNVALNGQTAIVEGDQLARRHGLTWPDEAGNGGNAQIQITATNPSGLTTTFDTTIVIPERRENTALLRRESTSIPRGHLLSKPTDFDGDGLRELVLNQSAEGGLSDTLRSFEWAGSGFAPADTLIATFFPKDVGNTNDDGLEELLLQVRGGTLLLEQATASSFPDQLVYADTIDGETGLSDVLNGVRLADLTGDGNDEIVGTTGEQWHALERTDSGFTSLFSLDNPTSLGGRDSSAANAFDEPEALVRDFDADGESDLLVGDRDGDLIVYESTGDGTMDVAWTHETDRVDAGNRFAAGNLTGEVGTAFVTMTTYFPRSLNGGEFAPEISYYSVWQSVGDDEYERVFRLPIAGPYVRQGSMTVADLDADGRDEVAISHAPSLIVLDRHDQEGWRVLHESRGRLPLQSRSLTAADFSGDGRPSVLAETAGEKLVRFRVDEEAVSVSPPQWVHAAPDGASSTELSWKAPGADSVVVFSGSPGEALNRLTATTDSGITVSGTAERRYLLRARDGSEISPLSTQRVVRPHAPALLSEVEYPSVQSVELIFSERLARATSERQFQLGQDGRRPEGLSRGRDGHSVVLRFDPSVAGEGFQLEWDGLVDTDGLPVGDTSTAVSFPSADDGSLYIEAADILDENHIRLVFSESLVPDAATDQARYDIQPRGSVSDIEQDAEDPRTVTLQVNGLAIGARGKEASLTVTEMTSVNGSQLAKEGNTIRLTQPADDLANVYVYPNPYRARDHNGTVTIAGLPREATIRIYAPEGRLVNVLTVEENRNGGWDWDLRDRRGDRVPSGIYLFRINAPEHAPVVEKAAVIR